MTDSCNPMDGGLRGSSIHGILQARILEWVVISFSRGSSQPRIQTRVSCIGSRFFTNWAPREAPLIGYYAEAHRLRRTAQKSDREELPLAQGQGWRPRAPGCDSTGVTQRSFPTPRSGAAAEKSNPTSKERLLRRLRRAERSYSTFKVRRGGREKIPLFQGKEQRLCFAGATVKRYPTSKVRETQVRR